jgi:cobalt/nickel transport system ATP-binding protein
VKRRGASRRAVVLVDHGSREAAANRQLSAVAAALRRRLPSWRVATAHLSIAAPGVPAAIAACVAAGAREVVVVPYFLGPGRHASRDVPQLAREARVRHPGIRIRVAPSLGVHAGIVATVVERVRGAARPRRAARSASRTRSR